MITAGELASLRADFEQTFTETAEIKRATTVKEYGANIETWSTVDTLIPCRRRPVSEAKGFAVEGVVGGRQDVESFWLVSLPAGTDVEAADRLIIGARTYEVTDDFDKTWEIQRQVLCIEIGDAD